MNIMTKRGSQDNVVTYEHLCDTAADLQNIDPRYITLGSIAIILQGTSGGLEIYIADSNKQWNSLTTISGGISGSDFSPDISNPQDGDTLVYDGTAGKWVNGAASGGESGIFKISLNTATNTLDKTWQEINNAVVSGKYCFCVIANSSRYYISPVFSLGSEEGDYFVVLGDSTQQQEFITNSANGYPVYNDN